MISKFLLFFFLIVLVFVAYGYWRAISSNTNVDSSIGPRIELEPTQFDFGEVKFGKVVEHTFKVKNAGEKVLEINRVSTSCACTKAKIEKEKIAPGETVNLLVTFDPETMGKTIIGQKVSRFIYLRSNDPNNPQAEATIHAHVK